MENVNYGRYVDIGREDLNKDGDGDRVRRGGRYLYLSVYTVRQQRHTQWINMCTSALYFSLLHSSD